MTGVEPLLASAVLKQVGGMLGTAIWKEIASQLNLSEDLSNLQTTFHAIKNVLVKAEKRSMQDGEVCIWAEELKAAAYDMEDMLMDFQYQIYRGNSVSPTAAKISIPLKLRFTMPGKLKDMRKKLEKIANLKGLDFTPVTSAGDQGGILRLPTSPELGEDIVGRTADKKAMMELLQEHCEHSILPIYGFGGLGKTTLAQMVYKDNGNFDIRLWIHVSKIFDLEKIGRSIISQVDGQSTQYDFSSVQLRVESILRENRCLIVLDDIWEEGAENLERLRMLLKVGKLGSKVIVTTRSKKVAHLMNEKMPFKLDVLPFKDCWDLFKAKAFQSGNVEHRMEKEKVGKKIVNKCKGVPLAVKSLGHRLNNEPLSRWEETLKSDLWQQERNPTSRIRLTAVLPSLKLSYYNMPDYLRPCFAYFSVFPTGFLVEKRDLSQQWTTLGFVASEHHPDDYLQEFVGMSFLQSLSSSPSIPARFSKPYSDLYRMHDLVHELARSIAGEEVAVFNASRGGSSHPKIDRCRYMLFSNFNNMTLDFNDMPPKARAIHFKDCIGLKPSLDTFSKTEWLRVLDFSGMGTAELPESMISLHHLQVLNLSENTCITKLQGFVCDFHKLQHLNLHGCSSLMELPNFIGKLKELIHLDLSKCTSLQELPTSLGDLQKLSFLNLSCCSQLETVPDTFIELTNLENLNMSACMFKQLPTMLFKRMKRLLFLDLSDCTKLTKLPESSEALCALLYLNLSGCSELCNILGLLTNFVSLKYLNLLGVGGRGDTEAPSTSAGEMSADYSHELQLNKLHSVLKGMINLDYLAIGGMTLFSEQGIAGMDELLTLPDFVVSVRGPRCSNIGLLQNIIDLTNSDLNVRCLEKVKSPEEANTVGLANKQHLRSLSLEWSLSEYDDEEKENDMFVLENLRPHRSLKHLTIKGYSHNLFPSWIQRLHDTLPDLVKIVLSDLSWCTSLPPLCYLSKLEEIEIRAMPMLSTVCIGQCKNLRRLSLVDLSYGATVDFDHDSTGQDFQTQELSTLFGRSVSVAPSFSRIGEGSGAGRFGLYSTSELMFSEPLAPAAYEDSNKMQGKTVAKAKGLLKALLCCTCIQKRDDAILMSATPPQLLLARSRGRCPHEEADSAIIKLNRLYVENCQYLRFYPSAPKSMEYIIKRCRFGSLGQQASQPSTPSLTSNMCIERCLEDVRPVSPLISQMRFERCLKCDVEKWIQLEGINIEELVINDCPDFYDLDDLYLDSLRRLKITNCMDLSLRSYPIFRSLEELEIDSMNDNFLSTSLLHKTTEASSSDEILDVPYVIAKDALYFSVKPMDGQRGSCYSSNIGLLFRRYYSEIEKLVIKNIENIKEPEEINEGDLGKCYHQLHLLSLMWSKGNYSDNKTVLQDDLANDSSILEKLRPPRSLWTLRIHGYRGSTVCSWLMNISSFVPNLVTVELANMPTCEQLPPLGQLEHLEVLHISYMPAIRTMDGSFLGAQHQFKKLREFTLNTMVNLEKWSTALRPSSGNEQLQHGGNEIMLPNLQRLVVKDCPKLRFYSGFTRAAKCVIESASRGKLLLSYQELIGLSASALCRIEIENCGSLTDGLEILQYLQDSVNLDHLTISHCSNLVTLPESIQGCRSLRELEILECWNFAELPEWLGELTLLTSLTVHAAKLQCLPQSIRRLGSLEKLVLKKCNYKLRRWCNSGENRDVIQQIANKGHVDTSEDPGFCIQSNGVELLHKITSFQLIQLNIQGLNALSHEEVEKLELVTKEHLCYLSLEWNESNIYPEVSEHEAVFEKLQPHHELKRLRVMNYIGLSFPNWMTSLQNLKRIEFSGLRSTHLPQLEQLKNLEELLISNMVKLIWITQPLMKLRRLVMSKVENREWEEPASLTMEKDCGKDDIFPSIEELQINECQKFAFLPSMARRTRFCTISGIKADLPPYKNADLTEWMLSLSNLQKLELSGLHFQNLKLDLLQNIEELRILEIDNLEVGASLCIVTTQPLMKLKRIVLSKIDNLLWETPTEIEVNMFPILEDLEIDCCYNLKFEPYFPRSSRYIISGSKAFPYKLPSFSPIMGKSASVSSSVMKIKYIDQLSSSEWEGIENLDIAKLTIEYCNDWYPLPKGIQNWNSLQSLEVLNCKDIVGLPDWLEEAAFLKYIKIETYGMTSLPPCIKRLTSLEELTLSKFNALLEESCMAQDWISVIKECDEQDHMIMYCSTSTRKQGTK